MTETRAAYAPVALVTLIITTRSLYSGTMFLYTLKQSITIRSKQSPRNTTFKIRSCHVHIHFRFESPSASSRPKACRRRVERRLSPLFLTIIIQWQYYLVLHQQCCGSLWLDKRCWYESWLCWYDRSVLLTHRYLFYISIGFFYFVYIRCYDSSIVRLSWASKWWYHKTTTPRYKSIITLIVHCRFGISSLVTRNNHRKEVAIHF